jgi:light-regulated signal transduction histidine kinase (bacteriophytochrome)
VLEPVETLAAQARAVAAGNVDRRILASGPPEIEALGDDVDAMRARIADELNRVERARTELLARTEDLARSNADLEQFAYVASHDLTEPLRKVANFCQLLERQYGDRLDDKAKQYIAFAVDGARRMQILITDLLTFSRVGRTTERFADVALDAVVDRAMANLDDSLAEAQAEIVRTKLPTVRGDALLLTALFQNLIGNSVKYRGEDPPRVEISATRGSDQWLVTISDNGIGIDPKYGDRVFAIFQRLHLRDQYDGTGIGLAMCRKIVEFHGGRIWLAEPVSRGATFRFTLAAEAE